VFTTLYRSVEIERTRYIHKYTYIWWYLDSHILQSSLQKGISRKKRKRCGRMLLSSYTIIHTLACVCSCISRYIYTFTKDFYLKKITRKLTVMVCLGEDSVKSGDFINSVVHHNSHSKNLFCMPKRTTVNIRLKTLLDRSLLLWYSWLALAAQQRCNLRSSINCGKIQGGVSVLHAIFSFVRYR